LTSSPDQRRIPRSEIQEDHSIPRKSLMHAPIPHTDTLICHPNSSSDVVEKIEARAWWNGDATIALTYTVRGDLARLRIPPPAPPRRSDRLWEHTCFEAFIGQKDKPEYYEFNISPSGEWAAYSFRSYRDGMQLQNETPPPNIAVRTTINSVELTAAVNLKRLQILTSNSRLRLGLSAVIEENNGTLSYWALKHPPGKPDFHHSDCFALELESGDLENRQAPGLAAVTSPRRE
jgi:hypothetical protein